MHYITFVVLLSNNFIGMKKKTVNDPLFLFKFRHGLGRTDYYILNDPELCFQEVLRKKVSTETSQDSKGAIKLESHEDILKFDKNEILVKLEKGEGTLKIEKVAVKKEGTSSTANSSTSEEKDKKKVEHKPPVVEEKVAVTVVKSEEKEEEVAKSNEEAVVENMAAETEESAEKKVVEEAEKVEEVATPAVVDEEVKETKEPTAKEDEEEEQKSVEPPPKPEVKEESETTVKAEEPEKEKPKSSADEAADLCSKQAAELKAMFPDLEVIQPLSRLSQIDTFVLREQKSGGALDFSETTVAQLFNNAVKWPKEYAIQVRLQHIIYAIETKEWPASKSFSAYANGIGNEFDIPIHELPNDPPTRRESSTPMSSIGDSELITITTDSMNRANSMKKRRRHIAIDVETERAKLQALLNNTPVLTNPLMKHGMSSWDDNDSEDSRRSTPVTGTTLQPPPAHQQTTRLLNMPYDLKYHASPKTIGQTTVIPGTSSTLTPIDLSSG